MTENARIDDVFDYSVVLVSAQNQETDISDLVYSVQIHQSIFSPAMTAKFTVLDGINFLNKHPVIGEEKIRISFRSQSQEEATRLEFAVVSCEDVEFDPSLMELRYTLWGTSMEAIADYNKAVQKSYKTPVHDIVTDIYTSFLQTTKPVFVERTEGRTGIVVPNLTPFQTLSWLKKRAISAENGTDVFASYETTGGFRFETVANMIRRGRQLADSPGTHRFKFQHSSLTDPTRETLEGSIVEFRQVRKFGMSELMQAGYFSAGVNKFNLDTAEMETNWFVLRDKIPSWTLTHDGRIHTDAFMAERTRSHKQYLIAYDPYRQETSVADHIAEKSAYLANLLQQQYETVVPASEAVRAGDLIYIAMPEIAAPEASSSTLQNQTNGYFLVGDIVHTISGRSKITAKMVIFKDSYSTEGVE